MSGVVALLATYNDRRFLDGWLENVADHVSGVVVLDDGSTDSTAELLRSDPRFSRVITVAPEEKDGWNEPRNREVLVRAGQEFGADWFVAFDADERVEDRFWRDLPRVLRWADDEGAIACSFRLREIWGSPDTFRSDGIWGRKRKAALFRNVGEEHQFDAAQWHGEWVPMQAWKTRATCGIDYDLYHLKMLHEVDRVARRRQYEALDPTGAYQSIGYAYLTDETGLELTSIGPDSAYRGRPTDGC